MNDDRDIHLSLEIDPQALFSAYLELRDVALDMAQAIDGFIEFAGWQWGYGSSVSTYYSPEIDPMRDAAAVFRTFWESSQS